MTWFRCIGGPGGGSKQIITPALITDVSEFTKVYDATSSINYGSLGAKVSAALDITDGDIIRAYMLGGWNDSHACFYDSENKIGAYAGYNFGREIHIDKVDFYIGKFVQQNKTLYATVQWLDSNGTWNDAIDLEISSSISYPLNLIGVYLNKKCYGVRWIHKNGDIKSSGNNIVFFGMLLYQYVDAILTKETASVFRWYYNSATTCWGILKKANGECIGMNGDNADTNIVMQGECITVTFHGTSQSVEVTANAPVLLKKYSSGRTLNTITPDEYTLSAGSTQTFTMDNLYGGLFFEASPT